MQNKFDVLAQFLIVALIFFGYYAILGIYIELFGSQLSRTVTMPLRIIVVLLIFFLILKKSYKKQKKNIVLIPLSIFLFVYVCRIIIEIFKNDFNLYILPNDVLIQLVFFSIIPFFYFYQKKTLFQYKIIYNSLVISGVVFSLVVLILYWDFLFIGIGRINQARYVLGYEITHLSPLILSYSSAILVGLLGSKYIFEKSFLFDNKYLTISICVVAVVPMLIGASRGSIIALFVPFLFGVLSSGKLKLINKLLVLLIVVMPLLIYGSAITGTSLIDRSLEAADNVSTGERVDGRGYYYATSIQQFIQNPVIGSSIQNESVRHYPHNIILEVLISTGFIGFIPFMFILILSIKRSVKIIKYNPGKAWVVILFWQIFIQHMFSHALYSATWFWVSLGLLFSVTTTIRK